MYGVVYCVTNRKTGRQYVGITTGSLRVRWAAHVRESRRAARWPLHRSIRKHGADAFSIEKLVDAEDRASLEAAEREWIDALGTKRSGYNLTLGGGGAAGFRWSAASRLRQSIKSKGRVISPEARQKMSAAKKGKPQSPDVVSARAAAQTGKKRSMATRLKLSAAGKGKIIPPATIEKIRQSRIGVALSESARMALMRPVIACGRRYKSLSEAANSLGVSAGTISRRIRSGIAGYKTLKPVQNRAARTPEQVAAMRTRQGTKVVIGGETYPSMEAAAQALGITRAGVAYRIKAGTAGRGGGHIPSHC